MWYEAWQGEEVWHNLGTRDIHKKEAYDLDVAIFSHRMWIRKVIEYIRGESDYIEVPEFDEKRCQFGLWYKGTGRARYGHAETYELIAQKHHEVHEMAKMLQEMADAGRIAQAEAGIMRFKQVSDELLALMDAMIER
jgi:hypothetical protein